MRLEPPPIARLPPKPVNLNVSIRRYEQKKNAAYADSGQQSASVN